ncbi:MAG TPA: hypothetical protein VGC79_16815 [Polyangiaceae bacterium]
MRSARSLGYYAPFLLGMFGCSVASAADGSVTTHGARAESGTASPVPPAYPVDAPPRHEPPQEMSDACRSLSEGGACRLNFNGETRTGICRNGPNAESELACVPARPPGPPPSGSNQTLTGSAMERQLDELEREIRGS